MPKMRRKSDLPQKICLCCGRPFAWRKKWARDWENVLYCSDRCRSAGKTPNSPNWPENFTKLVAYRKQDG